MQIKSVFKWNKKHLIFKKKSKKTTKIFKDKMNLKLKKESQKLQI